MMNDIAMGEKKNMNLPGVKVDLPVLQELRKQTCHFCLGGFALQVKLGFTCRRWLLLLGQDKDKKDLLEFGIPQARLVCTKECGYRSHNMQV